MLAPMNPRELLWRENPLPPEEQIVFLERSMVPFRLSEPYKGIKIVYPKVVEVVAKTDHSVELWPVGEGETKVYIVDDEGQLMKTLNIEVRHPVELLFEAGLKDNRSTYFCSHHSCRFLSATHYQYPEQVVRNIQSGDYNYNINTH
jgi:hypothetical protein